MQVALRIKLQLFLSRLYLLLNIRCFKDTSVCITTCRKLRDLRTWKGAVSGRERAGLVAPMLSLGYPGKIQRTQEALNAHRGFK
jgi:hypothetical protein